MGEYRVCSRCVMDNTASDIIFYENGFCNYCIEFENNLRNLRKKAKDLQAHQNKFINTVKADGKGKEYDCIVGVSGGVDSSYALYLAVNRGLRPLAVHLDNGWNSELASSNIANLVDTLGIDLYTHVIDWEENRDLQCAFFKANVVDIEMLMDNAMIALNYQEAEKYRLKYLLTGCNFSTEGMRMPPGWSHLKYDARNIRSIHSLFGSVPIKTHPLISVTDYLTNEFVHGIKWIHFLDYFQYVKSDALALLQKECAYKPYPYKHYESVFTRFYQGYILPRKFGIDKRRVHLSSLILSGQIERDEALRLLKESPYPDQDQEEQDRLFVMKKLGFTEESFSRYMHTPAIPHSYYESEEALWDLLVRLYKISRFITKGLSPG